MTVCDNDVVMNLFSGLGYNAHTENIDFNAA